MASKHCFVFRTEGGGWWVGEGASSSYALLLALPKTFESSVIVSTWVDYSEEFSSIQAKGVKVIAVGVGNRINKVELKKIAMGKEENVFQVSDFDKLSKELLQPIIDTSCPTAQCE